MSKDTQTPDVFIPLSVLSKRISTSMRTIRNWVKDAHDPIPAYRVGGKLLFRWPEVVKWIEGRRVVPAAVNRIVDSVCDNLKGGG